MPHPYALTEGNGVRPTARMEKVDKNTVMALGLRVGDGCIALHDQIVRGLGCRWSLSRRGGVCCAAPRSGGGL